MATFLIGLGSNRPHGRHGAPPRVLAAAVAAISASGIDIVAISPVEASRAIGSARDFANAAALIATRLDPPALLTLLKRIERAFGRRRGRRWAARVIDLDILAWSGGRWHSPPARLTIPHPALGARAFASGPAAAIAPDWRLPRGAGTLRQLHARGRKARPVDPRHSHP